MFDGVNIVNRDKEVDFSMVKIKSAEEINRRYKEAIPRVGASYKEQVAKVTDWQEKALAGQGVYEEKMANPEILARRGKAIAQVSNEDWKKKAVDLGAARIGPGMAANADKRTRNYEPIRSALAALDLPARTADPMANIDSRVKKVVQAEMDAKKARLG